MIRKNQENSIVCRMCMHHCVLSEGKIGRCGVRRNQDGKNICLNYGRVTAIMLDPVEKKPLRRFYPGKAVLSAGSFGCNLSCPFCQNHEISFPEEAAPESTFLPPEKLAELALKYKDRGNIGVAYTYNEPLIGYEYVRDTAKIVKEYGMKNVLVTNGSFDIEILEEVLPFIDAVNIDLKGFSQEYYRKLGGDLETVKKFIIHACKSCHVELTTLIVPDENDSIQDMEREAKWIASVNPEIPLHVTRFFPRYKMLQKEPSDVRQIYCLKECAMQYLENVYTGNC